jgi:hypothetical protein
MVFLLQNFSEMLFYMQNYFYLHCPGLRFWGWDNAQKGAFYG